MDNFNEQFDTMFQNIEKVDSSIILLGIDIILNTSDFIIKESILTKLLILFPKTPELYYLMGYIFKDIDINKAVMWFQLCIQLNSFYTENILDLTKILFDTKNIQYIHYLNDKFDIIINKNDDDRVLLLFANVYMLERKLKLARILFNKLLKNTETQEYKYGILKYYVYLNAASLFLKNSQINTSISLLERILLLYNNNYDYDYERNSEMNVVLKTAYENYVILLDYIYTDNVSRFSLHKKLNHLYKSNTTYSFKNRNNKKIKIGYVCATFQNHVISKFLLPLLKYHNREKFEIYLYSEKKFSYENCNSINIFKKTSIECSNIIYNDNIDILFDIDGYTEGNNKLEIFSHKPAPFQISYIGFPNSTGLDFIQYRITDSIADNIDSIQFYSEKLLRMPKCFLLFDTTIQANPVLHELNPKTEIILGSMNKESKNSKEVLETWRSILHKTENTKLLIKIDGLDNKTERTEYYKDILNVPEDRLIIIAYCSENEYVKLFGKIDILLDTFPYSGTTTTCNALYNSIPVVTLYNKDIHAHNVSSSLLINSEIPELVTFSKNDYINKVIELSSNYEEIIQYKTIIHKKFLATMEPTAFMNDYEKMLTDICSQKTT